MIKSINLTECPICLKEFSISLGEHIRNDHDELTLKDLLFQEKLDGITDIKITNKYGISFSYLQKVITEKTGTNISSLKTKKVKTWEPNNYSGEATSVWSFKNRGSWATHDGKYRGNWSPFIPRNIILKYSNPGDVVLDQFVGGGTTAVEAKLLGRQCIARDINSAAIDLSKEHSNFQMPIELGSITCFYEPKYEVGDARNLEGIGDCTIDLI